MPLRGSRPERTAIAAAILLFVCAIGSADDLRIGEISIRTIDVFDDEEAASGWAFAIANVLHIETREAVVRSFLLFREGDPYDPERIAETERNLRALAFLRSALITTSAPRNGAVDVVVITRDSWTTEPGLSFGSKGGGTSFGFDLEESNLLGTGKSLGLLYDSTPDRTRKGVELHDPAFFRPYWRADALVSENSDGREMHLAVRRPFASLETPFAGALSLSDTSREDRIYRDGVSEDVFEGDRRHFLAEAGFAIARSSTRATRLAVGLELEDAEFRAIDAHPATVPDDRHFRYVFARVERRENRFVKLNWINRDLRYEDFNLGLDLSAQVGFSPELLGAGADTGIVRVSAARGARLAENTFLLTRLGWESRPGAAGSNELLSAEVFGIHRFATRRPQTFVARLHYDQGHELDRDRQLFADADSGLRGYRLHAIDGERILIANAEHRIFFGRELFHLVSPGIAFFADAGGAARAGSPLDLYLDAGVGLRLGLTRTPRNSLRIDFAWAFDPDPLGRKGLLTSISMSKPF